eukprot:TRINITY_DN20308_c0_g1_i1.p2 TRINITY_DN20308_c0_g1~~TRINITY_DN20308_c0_g1_i1.p2  ORF type:complete len:104 (-),score=4.07 TRINITY_DN20308_c0_g1_i1:74-385(-)
MPLRRLESREPFNCWTSSDSVAKNFRINTSYSRCCTSSIRKDVSVDSRNCIFESKAIRVDITPRDTIARGISLSLIHISEPTRLLSISYAVFCLKKKKIKSTR